MTNRYIYEQVDDYSGKINKSHSDIAWHIFPELYMHECASTKLGWGGANTIKLN